MDRNAKLAAAKKKLNQFKRKKGHRKAIRPENPITAFFGHGSGDVPLPKGVSDEKLQNSDSEHGGCLMQSTAMTTETILQLSAKLNGLAAETEMFIDDSTLASSDEKFIDHIKLAELTPQCDFPKNLEKRNMELLSSLSCVSSENEELKQRCKHLLEEVSSLQRTLKKTQKQHGEENSAQEQLHVQMRTIGVLVSEKQDLQQALLAAQSTIHSLNIQQGKVGDDVKCMRDEVTRLRRELHSRSDALELAENEISKVKSDYSSCMEEVCKMKELLEKERLNSSELAVKLQSREASYRELQMSHTDVREKLDMADVLVQQLSADNDLNALSQLTRLQEDNDTMTLCLTDYQQAFQQLKAERESLNLQFRDARRIWEDQLNTLRERISSLEIEKQGIYEDYTAMQASLEQIRLSTQEPDSRIEEGCSQQANLRTELEEVTKNHRLVQEEMIAQRNNNQLLATEVHEKECCIIELENELQQAKMAFQGHEQLLIQARNDKATISRALMQNSQLKDQLEEIQEGFIRMTNDKMDLATKVSFLEHANKDLVFLLNEGISEHKGISKSIEQGTGELQQLQLNDAHGTNGDTQIESGNASAESDDGPFILNNYQLTEDLKAIAQAEHHNEESDLLLTTDSIQLSRECVDSISSDCFNAQKLLQEKFSLLSSEKAELLNRLELLEHANTQLQNECDTIGEYIALYHHQRQILRSRHREKDEYISSIVREREAMQVKVQHLQTLMVAMLKNQQDTDVKLTSVYPGGTFGSKAKDKREVGTRLLKIRPDLISEKDYVHSESSDFGSDDRTACQILSLLEDMQKPTEATVWQKTLMPSGFGMNYIGPYTAI